MRPMVMTDFGTPPPLLAMPDDADWINRSRPWLADMTRLVEDLRDYDPMDVPPPEGDDEEWVQADPDTVQPVPPGETSTLPAPPENFWEDDDGV